MVLTTRADRESPRFRGRGFEAWTNLVTNICFVATGTKLDGFFTGCLRIGPILFGFETKSNEKSRDH